MGRAVRIREGGNFQTAGDRRSCAVDISRRTACCGTAAGQGANLHFRLSPRPASPRVRRRLPKGPFWRFSSRRRGNLHPRAAQARFRTSAQPHGHSGERRPGRIRRIGPITQSRPEGGPVILSNDRSGPGCPGTSVLPGIILSLRRPACPPTTGAGLERVPSSVLLRTPGAGLCCSCCQFSESVPRRLFLPNCRQPVLPVHLPACSSLAALLCCISPVAGDVRLQDDRVEHDPVDGRGGGHGVGEDALPLAEDQVGRDAQRR